MKNINCIIAILMLSGCASITNSKIQPVSVMTFYNDKEIEGASCSLTNDKGTWFVTSPGTTTIQKSYGDMNITCRKKGIPAGIASTQSSSNGGVWGNILAGGIIGYAVDASSGAGFDYPSTINVQMGRTLLLQPIQATNRQSKVKKGTYDNLNH